MTLKDNKAIVRSFLEKGNREERTPTEMCAPGFTANIGAFPAMDLEAFKKYQANYFSAFSGSNILIEDIIAEGNRVAFRGLVRATHTGEFNNVQASGKQIAVPVIGIAHLSEGKISKWWNSPDRLSWMQQIGVISLLG